MPKNKTTVWPNESRIDAIGQNGNTGDHYIQIIDGFNCVMINQFYHRINPNGSYALYLDRFGEWRESASITNSKVKI